MITVTAKDDSAWDVDRFREDFRRSECYWAPLKLEAADNAHFLETALELDANGGFRMRLKNVNEGCEREPRVWRYHRWDSFTCAKMKETTKQQRERGNSRWMPAQGECYGER